MITQITTALGAIIFIGIDFITSGLHLLRGGLSEHVPVPLVDLALLEACSLVERLDFASGPVRILLELCHEDLVLCSVLSQAFLSLFASFGSVADDHGGNFILFRGIGNGLESCGRAAFLLCRLLLGAF